MCTSAIPHSFVLHIVFYLTVPRACNSNFIGYDFLYGSSHHKAYSPYLIAIGNIIREISSQSVIPNFSHDELEVITCSASTMYSLVPSQLLNHYILRIALSLQILHYQ